MLLNEPTHFFLCAGHAEGYTILNAFDAALIDAGVGNVNLIKLSSILPPGVEETTVQPLPYGSFLPIAYASINTSTPQEIISAAVACARPKDKTKPGVIMEYSSRGHKEDVERIVRSMAEEAMKYRGFDIEEILSTASEHQVESIGAAFAAVALVPLDKLKTDE